MPSTQHSIGMAGLGLRRDMWAQLQAGLPEAVDFWEIAPENWLPLGGRYAHGLAQMTASKPFVCHGLSLSIGSPDPLDMDFLKALKGFFREHNIALYSEHLSYCSSQGHLYDLMPIPFTAQSALYVAERIRIVQDVLEQPLAIENVSYYAAPEKQMPELEFLLTVLDKADCQLLLDVNNIYVNSINHGYDAKQFLQHLPSKRIAYGHIAGHFKESEQLLIDTHGADVPPSVWQLLELAYQMHGVFPTLIERDFNIPPLAELLAEVAQLRAIQQRCGVKSHDLA